MIAKKKEIRRLLVRMSEEADQKAFEELFDLYYNWLHSVAISIIRNKEEAEEIVEDVFLKLWEIREGFSNIKNLETYLYAATKNKSYDYYKKSSKVHLVEIESNWKEKDYIITPEDVYLYEELKSKCAQAIDSLPIKCKQAYKLVKEEGCSYAKAAQIMNVSDRTVENHLRTAVRKIREGLAPYLTNSDEQQVDKIYTLLLLF